MIRNNIIKSLAFSAFTLFLISSCKTKIDKEKIIIEIFKTEKAFEKMASEKSISEAFYYYAAPEAVIKRENDTLIKGKENIKHYYKQIDKNKATVSWTPDFVEVSDCGTLAYTFGKYVWKIQNHKGKTVIYKGVFHTVWQKQQDNSWKYVWD